MRRYARLRGQPPIRLVRWLAARRGAAQIDQRHPSWGLADRWLH